MNFNLWVERDAFKLIEKKKHSASVEFFVEVLSTSFIQRTKDLHLFSFSSIQLLLMAVKEYKSFGLRV